MKRLLSVFCAASVLAFGAFTSPASAQRIPWVGEIVAVGFNFCPRSTINAHGELLPIAQNTALFSLYGTQFGGDGRTTFGVPDLQGRSPLGQGRGAGLPDFRMGQKGGAENAFLNVLNLPSHNHTAATTATSTIAANPGQATAGAAGKGLAGNAAIYSGTGTPSQGLMADVVSTAVTTTIGNTGGSQGFGIRDPFQVIRFCVVTDGVYPSRS